MVLQVAKPVCFFDYVNAKLHLRSAFAYLGHGPFWLSLVGNYISELFNAVWCDLVYFNASGTGG